MVSICKPEPDFVSIARNPIKSRKGVKSSLQYVIIEQCAQLVHWWDLIIYLWILYTYTLFACKYVQVYV